MLLIGQPNCQATRDSHMLYEYACFEGDFRHISLLTGVDMTKDAK